MVRNRLYDELARRIGPVVEIIEGFVERTGGAQVLEIGAGSGLVMHQLQMIFGDRLEICGLNRRLHHGSQRLSLEAGLEDGIFDHAAIDYYRSRRPPLYVCADAGISIPLADACFDFAYSQATIPFIADKANLIHEVNRVLKPGGFAHLQMNLNPRFMLGDTDSLFRIRRNGQVRSIEQHAGEVDGLSAHTSPAGVAFIRIEKRPSIPLRLVPESFALVGDPECPYVESTYLLN